MPEMKKSIERRLSLATASALLLAIAAFSGAILWVTRQTLTENFDQSLFVKAKLISGLVEYEYGQIEFDVEDLRMSEYTYQDNPEYYQVWVNEKLIAKSPSLNEETLGSRASQGDIKSFENLVLPDRRSGRACQFTVEFAKLQNEHPVPKDWTVTVLVARDRSAIDQPLDSLMKTLISVALIFVTPLLLLARWLTRRGLRPLRKLAKEISEIDVKTLNERVSAEDGSEETAHVIETLNKLLTRLDAVREREQAFSAEVAHELRTPIAGLFSVIEVALRRERESSDYKNALDECFHIVEPLMSMLEILLNLSQIEKESFLTEFLTIDLCSFVTDCWGPHEADCLKRELTFFNDIPENTTLVTNPDLLILVLTNAFKNAVTYTDLGGQIWVRFQRGDVFDQVIVENTGCTLTEKDLEHVFERFWRHDLSRSNTGKNFGLGLAFVKRVGELLGGRVSVSVTNEEHFILTLSYSKKDVLKCCV